MPTVLSQDAGQRQRATAKATLECCAPIVLFAFSVVSSKLPEWSALHENTGFV